MCQVLTEIPGVFRALDDLEHFRVIGQPLHVGMQVNFTEALGDADLFLRRQLLVAEEHHLVRQERVMHVGEIVVAHGRQIDAMQLGTQRAGNGLHFDRIAAHPWFLRGG